MSTWQKRARVVMAVVGLAVVVLVALSVRGRHAPQQNDTIKRIDPNAVSESKGVRLTQSTGLKVPGIVDAEDSLVYADGTMRLIHPKITKDHEGRQFVITGNDANVAAEQSGITIRGDVRLASSDGLSALTNEASYGRSEGIVRGPGHVSFKKGSLSGTAVGFTYDQTRDVLWLLDHAHIVVAPTEQGGRPADITAGAAGYARRDHYMRFERRVRLLREGRIVEADSAVAYLTPDGNRLQNLELRGQSHIVTNDAAAGGLKKMTSRDANLTYGADGESLEHAVLSGSGVVELAGQGGTVGKRIAGELIDIVLGPGGAVTSMTARDNVQLTIPAGKDTPERVIRSAAMEGTGEAGQGLTAARFLNGVEYREAVAPDRPRQARARTLEVQMTPGSGAIETARFSGSTRFEDGTLRAAAADGEYQIAKGMLVLTGAEANKDPRVQDERITVDAKRIDLTFEGTKLVATGEVRSELKPDPKKGRGTAGNQTRVPGMLKDDKPVNVTGATLNYDGGNSLATYSGGSRLWQEDTTIQAPTIILDEKSGDLKAEGGVKSAFTLEQVDHKTNQPTKVPSLASGETLHYEDSARRARYMTNAHVNGPQGDCHAVMIDLFFAETGNTLERAEAERNVNLLADERTATGAHMTYWSADEKYLMHGEPVTIIEHAECRETTGKILTFWRSTDRIIVDGKDQLRTLTKSTDTKPSGAVPTPSSAVPTCSQTRRQ